MPEEFEGDLAGAVFWGADLSGARFRDVNLTDARISHAWLVNVDIDALVDKVVINGVDVTAYVNERDPWYPLRAMLRPSSPEGMRATWAALEDEWAKTVARAQALPEDALHESVNDEWTLRPDAATSRLRDGQVVHGADPRRELPPDRVAEHAAPSTSRGPASTYDLTPSVSEALAVRADRATRFRDYLASVATTDFARPIDVLENGTNPLQRVHLHRLRGGVLAQPLRAARPRAPGSDVLGRPTPVRFAVWRSTRSSLSGSASWSAISRASANRRCSAALRSSSTATWPSRPAARVDFSCASMQWRARS